jgi:hypothetical protein
LPFIITRLQARGGGQCRNCKEKEGGRRIGGSPCLSPLDLKQPRPLSEAKGARPGFSFFWEVNNGASPLESHGGRGERSSPSRHPTFALIFIPSHQAVECWSHSRGAFPFYSPVPYFPNFPHLVYILLHFRHLTPSNMANTLCSLLTRLRILQTPYQLNTPVSRNGR